MAEGLSRRAARAAFDGPVSSESGQENSYEGEEP